METAKIDKKKKVVIAVVCIAVITAVVGGIIWYNETRWEKIFEIKYVGRNKTFGAGEYEITNTTNKTYRHVYAVVLVEDIPGTRFRFKELVTSAIRPGETVTFKLYNHSVESEAEKRDIELILYTSSVSKIVFE